ncbi:unnamed protein product [Schistosoma mattheei]|uniref:Uncharacterized protein n=1 Tax=Schistosoma mattheei TaxID=31246 RepID=A0A183PFA6_9TREM|nr:unnamed protein product [Schistosoma mattheei]
MKTYVKNTNQSTKIIDENKTGSMVDRMVAYTSDQCVATMGTTSTCEFENLYEIGNICKCALFISQ